MQKLDEAKYFLSQMEEHQNDFRLFLYNLNAFLSTARSITFVLQKEGKGNMTFQKWYNEKKVEMENDWIMQYCKNARNCILKEGKDMTDCHVHVKIHDKKSGHCTFIAFDLDDRKEQLPLAHELITNPPKGMNIMGFPNIKKRKKYIYIETEYFFKELSEKYDVFTICQEYLEKLGMLVKEAEPMLK